MISTPLAIFACFMCFAIGQVSILALLYLAHRLKERDRELMDRYRRAVKDYVPRIVRRGE